MNARNVTRIMTTTAFMALGASFSGVANSALIAEQLNVESYPFSYIGEDGRPGAIAGQSFLATEDGLLGSIDLGIKSWGETPNPLVFTLYNLGDATPIATKTFAPFINFDDNFLTSFYMGDLGVNLNVGESYAFGVWSLMDAKYAQYVIQVGADNPYANGGAMYGHPDWSTEPSVSAYYDLAFRVETIPIPAAAWLFGSALVGLVGIKRKK